MEDENVSSVPPQDPGPATPPPTEGSDLGGPVVDPGVPDSPPSGAINWDDDQNPHKYAAAQLSRRMEELEQASLESHFAREAERLQDQGLTPDQVHQTLQLQWQQMAFQRQVAQLNEQARPVVAQVLSDRIKAEYGVDITPKELMFSSTGQSIGDGQAMLARADALIGERRRSAFQARQKAGADKVDGGPTPTTANPARFKGMTPTQILALGLKGLKEE